jgi:hypothetical protein
MASPVIRAGVLVCLVVLVGCVAPQERPREEWLRSPRARGAALCSWADARWEDGAPLLVRGTVLTLGRARARWDDGEWRGAMVSGSLRKSGPVLVFDGRWSGEGVVLEAMVDASENAVFRAHQPLRFGAAGLAMPGAAVRVVDGEVGGVLAQPVEEALGAFAAREPPLAELDCGHLTLHAPRDPKAFAATASPRFIPQGARLDAADEPGGLSIGHFVAGEAPLRGYVLAEAGDEVRFAAPTASGLVWVGWVPREALVGPAAPEAAPETVELKPSRAALPAGATWRACEEEELELSVWAGDRLVRAGAMFRGTRFGVGRRLAGHVEVLLDLPWFQQAPDVVLLASPAALRCPLATRSSP